MKYLFGSSFFRPYLQAGVGVAAGGGTVTIGNGAFGGVGFFLMGSPIYFYLSYLFSNSASFQWGVGYTF